MAFIRHNRSPFRANHHRCTVKVTRLAKIKQYPLSYTYCSINAPVRAPNLCRLSRGINTIRYLQRNDVREYPSVKRLLRLFCFCNNASILPFTVNYEITLPQRSRDENDDSAIWSHKAGGIRIMRVSFSISRYAAILLASTAIGLPTLAAAQEAVTGTAAETADEGIATEIIVTANKRSESLQKVPISISAFSGEQIERLGITDTTQITQQIPALRVNAFSPNLTIFSLRGISQSNFTDNLEAPVAVYQDNAYIASMNAISGQLFDIKRVEVLRGPQGTLFGRNATGGLIHYLSQDASNDEFNGYVQGEYGRFESWSLEGAVGGQLADGFRVRAAARMEQANGYIKSRGEKFVIVAGSA
ncbi:MAG: TonB-dependent receptor, partial [Novosphingobium sp.]